MKFSLLLALKHIRSDNKSGFIKTASTLSIIGLSIGVSALLITLFILNGFERVISEKITQVDGHIRVKHFLNEPFNPSIYNLEKKLSTQMNSVSISQYTQNTALLRKGQFAEGVVVEGMNEEDLEFIDKMVVEGSSRLIDKGVIIGKSLADLLGISLNDKITIFDLTTLYLI